MSSASEIAQFIRSHDDFLITTHVFPDGDNMGCVLALSEGLEAIGKRHAGFVEGPITRMYNWMPGVDRIFTELSEALAKLDDGSRHPTLFVVDSGDIHRMGDSFEAWFRSNSSLDIANVDHHGSNTYFGTTNWVDPSYSSVGEMIYEILRELDVKITSSIAQNLFVSVYTDTGRFSFSNTSQRSLKYAGEFVAAGAKPILAFRHVYANRTLASFHLQSEAFHTLTRFLDGKGCYFWVDGRMLDETNTTLDDTEGLIDTVRTLRDFLIVVFFKEISPNDTRLSTRAGPPIDASALMALFGGGGHPRAAGCRIDRPLQEAIELFVARAEEAIRSGEVMEKTRQAQ
jgi:phosphoesterase RecJ-like protein